MVNRNYQIGDFRFDPTTGELTDLRDDASVNRLPPQPGELLRMLVQAHPEIVTRSQIQEQLWPGVKSNFDSNLHFCVRQLRAAFGDQASTPKYIETLPRRGYRLIADPSKVNDDDPIPLTQTETLKSAPEKNRSAEHAVAVIKPILSKHSSGSTAKFPQLSESADGIGKRQEQKTSHRSKPLALIIFCVLVIAGILTIWNSSLWDSKRNLVVEANKSRKIRIAIMPFRSDLPGFESLGNGEIATDCLNHLSEHFDTYDVLGPAATTPYFEQDMSLPRLAKELDIDIILNGRFVASEDSRRLLVEVIRTDNGRHVWVKYFDTDSQNSQIAQQVVPPLLEAATDYVVEFNN